jgi:hypothetical protein
VVTVALGVGGGVSNDELARNIDGASEGLNAETLAGGVGDGERATGTGDELELATDSGALRGVVPPAWESKMIRTRTSQSKNEAANRLDQNDHKNKRRLLTLNVGGPAGAVSSLGATTLETVVAVSSGAASPLATGGLTGLGGGARRSIPVGDEAIDASANALTLGLAPETALGISAGKLALVRGLEVAAVTCHRNGNKAGEESKNGLHCTKMKQKRLVPKENAAETSRGGQRENKPESQRSTRFVGAMQPGCEGGVARIALQTR